VTPLERAARALLKLIAVPENIRHLIDPSTKGTYNQRVLALEAALDAAPTQRGGAGCGECGDPSHTYKSAACPWGDHYKSPAPAVEPCTHPCTIADSGTALVGKCGKCGHGMSKRWVPDGPAPGGKT
jgi:hypothetical protein